jgi:lysophospholipase L1-like esterase
VQQVANNTASHFLDAAKHCTVSAIDGIHLDEAGHLALAQAIAEKINALKL